MPILLTSGFPIDQVQNNLSSLALGSNLLFFVTQALLTGRLVRKNYRSFRVYVVRHDGEKSRTLSMREIVSVWLWIFWPQCAFVLITSVIILFWDESLAADTVRGLSSWSLLIRHLVVGPYAVGFALRAQYKAFRLEAHGFRYV